jgi:membrane protease subunit (stomatin/prohibitin family)
MSFIKKQFLEIIQWEDDSQEAILFKFPMQDNEIMNNGKLVVRPGQCAIFLDEGRIADIFTEPNTYTLNTKNLPILADLKGWGYGFQSPFKSDVYFINTKQFLAQKWGTPAPVLIPDPKFEQVEIKAFGTFEFRIADPKQFLTSVTSTNRSYTVQDLGEQLKGFIITNFAPLIVRQGVTAAQFSANYKLIDDAMIQAVASEFASLGVEMTGFQVQGITLQEEYQEMLRKRTGVNIMGGMQNYAQVETLDAMKESVANPGINPLNQTGLGMGMGLGMGGMFAQNLRGALNNPDQTTPGTAVGTAPPVGGQPAASGAGPACPQCKASNPPDSKFCSQCGTLLPAPAQASFCNQCGAKLAPDSLFCSKCGAKQGEAGK